MEEEWKEKYEKLAVHDQIIMLPIACYLVNDNKFESKQVLIKQLNTSSF